MKLNHCITIVLLLVLTATALGRDQSGDNWYFGSNAGVTFVNGTPQPLAGGQINTTEGCASISDSSGNLLFYTDGSTVWNASHGVMPNGTGLLGNSSAAQSAIIVPNPGSSTSYYIFTVPVSCGVGLNYSEVDLTLDSGNGDVVTATKNTQVLASSSEVVTVVPHSNGSDYWVVARKCGENSFSAFHVSSAGVNGTPVETSTGTTCASPEIGYLKASPNGDRLGMSFYFTDTAEYYDFDAATGQVSNAQNLGSIASAYGFEFSPDGSKIYTAPYGGAMLQFDLDAADVPASKVSLGTAAGSIGAIQNGPDGKTYFSVGGQSYLGVINQPDVAGASCDFQAVGPNISGTCSVGLPTIIPAFFATTTKPTVTTTAITNAAATTADSGGNVTDEGGASVTARGVCWSTTALPTIANSKTTNGTGAGAFTSQLTGLTAGTTYYVRAYATNSVGTGYGAQQSFTTATDSGPDLRVTVTSPTDPATVNQELPFGINVQNASSTPATNVVLRVPLPADTEFVSASRITNESADSVPLDASVENGVIVINLGNVSGSEEIKLSLILRAKASGGVTLEASLTSTENPTATTAQADAEVKVDDAYYVVVRTFTPFNFCGLLGVVSPLLIVLGIVGLKRRVRR